MADRPLPTAKELGDALDLSDPEAFLVAWLIQNDDELPLDWFPQTEAWVRQCYHRPSDGDITEEAIAEVLGPHLGFFGWEHVFAQDPSWPYQFRTDPYFSYLNAGDTYSVTLCRNEAGDYFLDSYGDVIEEMSRTEQEDEYDG